MERLLGRPEEKGCWGKEEVSAMPTQSAIKPAEITKPVCEPHPEITTFTILKHHLGSTHTCKPRLPTLGVIKKYNHSLAPSFSYLISSLSLHCRYNSIKRDTHGGNNMLQGQTLQERMYKQLQTQFEGFS